MTVIRRVQNNAEKNFTVDSLAVASLFLFCLHCRLITNNQLLNSWQCSSNYVSLLYEHIPLIHVLWTSEDIRFMLNAIQVK